MTVIPAQLISAAIHCDITKNFILQWFCRIIHRVTWLVDTEFFPKKYGSQQRFHKLNEAPKY